MHRELLTPQLIAKFSPALGLALAQATGRSGMDLALDRAPSGMGRFVAVLGTEVVVAGKWSMRPTTAWRTFAAAVAARLQEIADDTVWN